MGAIMNALDDLREQLAQFSTDLADIATRLDAVEQTLSSVLDKN